MADSRKLRFSKSPILKKISRKFHRLVPGLVRLIDAKAIDVAQSIWPWGCPTLALKHAKNGFFVFLGCFWPYAGQPNRHIGWATWMPFTSINPTDPRTNLWNFSENVLRIGDFEILSFFESAILIFFFFFASFP